jgi:hypothetical protein
MVVRSVVGLDASAAVSCSTRRFFATATATSTFVVEILLVRLHLVVFGRVKLILLIRFRRLKVKVFREVLVLGIIKVELILKVGGKDDATKLRLGGEGAGDGVEKH